MQIHEILDDSFYVVVDITGESIRRERLSELGLHIGCRLRLVQRLPFAGPFVVATSEGFFALRREEAQCLWVQKSHQ